LENEHKNNADKRRKEAQEQLNLLDKVAFNFIGYDDRSHAELEDTVYDLVFKPPRISMIGYTNDRVVNRDTGLMKFALNVGDIFATISDVKLEEKTRIKIDFTNKTIEKVEATMLTNVGNELKSYITVQNEADQTKMCNPPVAQTSCKAATPWILEQENRVCHLENGCPGTEAVVDAAALVEPHEIDPPAPMVVYFDFLINRVTLSNGICRDRFDANNAPSGAQVKDLKFSHGDFPHFCVPDESVHTHSVHAERI